MEEEDISQTPPVVEEVPEFPEVEFPQEEGRLEFLSKLASKKLLVIALILVGFLVISSFILLYWLNAQSRARLDQRKVVPIPTEVEEVQEEVAEEAHQIEAIDLGDIDLELQEIEEDLEKL